MARRWTTGMILAILQARLSSSRLPGKVLMPILGKPMLQHEIERVQRAKKVDRLVVATSISPEDQAIEAACARMDVRCFRGSLNDVLDRFYQASRPYAPEHVIRITGDCPLIDPGIMDRTIDYYLKGDFDYVSNALEPTFPDGLDTEIFRYHCLETAWKDARLPSEREHVTPFLYQNKKRFKIGSYKNNTNLSALRWTVDESIDFNLVTAIYQALYAKNPAFATEDILSWLESHSTYKTLNSAIQRNEGSRPFLEKNV